MDNNDKPLKPRTLADLERELQEADPVRFAVEMAKMTTNVHQLPPIPSIYETKLTTYFDLTNDIPKQKEYILYPCLPTQGIGFIYAATGLGKTMFTLNLAYAIAGGGNFLKYSAPLPRKVLYIDGEMSYDEMQARFQQIRKQQGELAIPDNWTMLTPDKFLPHRLPMIDTPEGQIYYQDLIAHNKIEVLVIDNLSMLSSIDENKSVEWKIVQDWLRYLRSIGITTLVVHHAGKDKNGYRGTSRMLDCANVAISLQPIIDDNMEDECVNIKKIKIVYQKARGFQGLDCLPYEVSFNELQWNYRSLEQNNMEKIVERMNIGMSQKEIAHELQVSRPYVSKMVKKGKSSGMIREG